MINNCKDCFYHQNGFDCANNCEYKLLNRLKKNLQSSINKAVKELDYLQLNAQSTPNNWNRLNKITATRKAWQQVLDWIEEETVNDI